MKHRYKSILYAGMALAAVSVGHIFTGTVPGLLSEKETSKTVQESSVVSEDMMADIRSTIAQREYNITFDEVTQCLQSPNRQQNLRAYYKPGKFSIKNRVDSSGYNFRLELVNEGIFADGQRIMTPQDHATPENKDNHLIVDHGSFSEEFINNEQGVRQNFIIERAPEGTRELTVKLAASGLQVRNGAENELRFFAVNPNGKTEDRLVYSDLKCWDANKQPLAASLAYVNDRIEIKVEVEDADFPVTIDPILANTTLNNADKLIDNNQSNSWLGFSVASAGDINGDGYSDVLVGAPKYDNGQTDEGAAYVFLGTTVGLGLQNGKILEAQQDSALMGTSVSSAGDVNKDGFSDILVGVPYYDKGEKNEGIVQLYLGSQSGVSSISFTVLEANQAGACFGISTALAGDVNADGYSDVLIGAHLFDKGQVNEGAAFLYYGSPNSLQINSPEFLESNQSGAMMGYAVAGAGDVNNDGASDIMVGARLYSNGETYEGAVFIYKGSVLSTPVLQNGPPQIIESNQIDARLGHALSTAGDVNGDGYSDVILAAYLFDNGQSNEGAVFIHHGSANGVDPVAAKTIEGNQIEAQMGFAVNAAGDHNGDGYGDIIIGARFYDNGQANEGAVFVHNGSPTGVSQTANAVIESNQGEAWMGNAVASAGDVNGDGYSDIVVGVYTYDNGQNDEGIVVIYNGKPDVPGAAPKVATLTAVTGASAGASLSIVGDLDGDGLDDIAVGAPNYDNGQNDEGAVFIHYGDAVTGTSLQKTWEGGIADIKFGSSVSGAGDVNGDGFSDIALGAYQYDKGSSNEGVVMIHYGSANGINTVPSLILEGEQIEAQFGISVACAGDVNADGFADLIVGARYYDKGQANEGAAFIYEGSKNGLNTTPISVLESNQGEAWLGSAVAPAGDVNGDGFSDVLVGSCAFDHGQTDEGSVFVWHGGGQGPDEAKSPIVVSQLRSSSYEGNQVASGGDINGDGYSDVIVGAIKYQEYPATGIGAVLIYYGSPTGISSTDFDVISQNQTWPYPKFGCSVSSAGDVNGDGFDDVIIGAYAYQTGPADAGAAFIYYGSADGINLSSSTLLFDPNVNSEFGRSVSEAGDINNDGYDDVIIGAPLYQSNQTSHGAAYIYWGAASGVLLQPQILEAFYINSQFGYSVSGAGDTNGDGFHDVIIGANKFSDGESNEGAAFLYLGSPSGIAANELTVFQSNQPDAEMGSSVSTAGDINRDGFGDIIIGAPRFGNNMRGAAFTYYGSANGVSPLAMSILEISNMLGGYFGNSVKSSGDVNGDGYGDVIVGAQEYQENKASDLGGSFVFQGSPDGVVTSQPSFKIGAVNYGELMGCSVSGAGDVNADGYSDIVIGSPFYNWCGGSLVYYGGQKLNLKNNLRLYNTDLSTPINHTQFPQTNFGAGLFAKSFTGRNKGKLVWETRPLAQGFSKGSNNRITNSTQSTNSQNAYSNLGTAGFELKNLIDKQGPGTKVRVRVKYDPVLALTGQSYGPWRYLPAYLMGNSTTPVPEEEGNDLSETIQKKPIPMEDRKALELANIYPNPVSNRLNIDFKDKDQIQSLKILTTAGSVAYQSNGFQPFVDVSKLSEGTYFLIITKTDGSHTTRQILIRR